jgi:hypothetical protein
MPRETRAQGHLVIVQKTDGTELEGVLKTGWWKPNGPQGVALAWARPRGGPGDTVQLPKKDVLVARADFVRCSAANVDIYTDELTEAARRKGGEVLADTEIEIEGGRAEFGVERDLVTASDWLGDDTAAGFDGGLGGGGGGGGGRGVQRGWDQFAVNERMGGHSTYSDELYTTKISDKKFSAAQLAEADRIARAIEGKATTNRHVAEERGQREVQEEMEGDMDEEDKYSMVLGGRAGGAAPAAPPASAQGGATPVQPAAAPTQTAEISEGACSTQSVAAAAPPSTPSAPAGEAAAAPAVSTPTTAPAPSASSSKLRASAKEFVPGGPKPTPSPAAAAPSPGMGTGSPAYTNMGSPQMMPQQGIAHMAAMGQQHAAYAAQHQMTMQPGQQYMIAQQQQHTMTQQQVLQHQQAQQQQHVMMQQQMAQAQAAQAQHQQAAQQAQQMQQMRNGMPMAQQSPGMVVCRGDASNSPPLALTHTPRASAACPPTTLTHTHACVRVHAARCVSRRRCATDGRPARRQPDVAAAAAGRCGGTSGLHDARSGRARSADAGTDGCAARCATADGPGGQRRGHAGDAAARCCLRGAAGVWRPGTASGLPAAAARAVSAIAAADW